MHPPPGFGGVRFLDYAPVPAPLSAPMPAPVPAPFILAHPGNLVNIPVAMSFAGMHPMMMGGVVGFNPNPYNSNYFQNYAQPQPQARQGPRAPRGRLISNNPYSTS